MTQYRNEMLYRIAVSIGLGMLEKGLISPEEYAEIDTILLKKYRPYLCGILSKKACYSSPLEQYIDLWEGEETIENDNENRTENAAPFCEKTRSGIRKSFR